MQEYVAPVISDDSVSKTFNYIIWYVVALWILLALAANILLACVLYCLVKGKSFAGSYQMIDGGYSVKVGCQ